MDVKYGDILGPEAEQTRSERVRTRFWSTFRKAARQIPFAEDLVAAYYCALDPSTPGAVRATLLGALAYFVLPTTWTGKTHGQPFSEDGGWAFVLARDQDRWRIRSYAWAVTAKR